MGFLLDDGAPQSVIGRLCGGKTAPQGEAASTA
jgi:hypothetical protein